MKHHVIPFRDLLQRVLPVHRLSPEDQARVARVLEGKDPRAIERLGLDVLDRLTDLGHLRFVGDRLQGDETVRRYRDLTTGNTIDLRTPAADVEEDVLKIPLPLRDWEGQASLDQIRTLFHLVDKILTQDSQKLRSPADVLRQVMLTARQVLQVERVSYWDAPRKEETALHEIADAAYDETMAREWALEKGHLVVYPELPAQIDPDTGELEQRFRSLAMVPVGADDLPACGVIQAWSVRPYHFGEDRQGLLSLLSECATDLLRRGQVLENLVFVDAGTQVYNRTYFNLQLENEIARAKRDGQSLALAIADIDDFRSFNSRYGYEGGNEVLAATAQVLKSGLRPFDSVARWGGEEFALVLTPPVTLEDAAAVCERLRRSTELSRITVTGLSGEAVTTQLTISIGGAVYPQDGSSAASLWRAANAALLQAKRTGKNKVVFASSLPGNAPA